MIGYVYLFDRVGVMDFVSSPLLPPNYRFIGNWKKLNKRNNSRNWHFWGSLMIQKPNN